MGAAYFRSSILALAGVSLALTLRPALAQTVQPGPSPSAPAVVTRPPAKPTPILDKPAPTAPAPGSAPAPQGVAPNAAAPRAAPPGDVAGRYIILREGGKDVGCMLTLEGAVRGPGGDLKAQLAPACRDQGIVVFDPVAWRVERGRLILTARKGHAATFDKQPDGAWWKDPAEGGKPLGVKKI